MSQITRLFASHQDAEAAAAELKAYRYDPASIHIVDPPVHAAGEEGESGEHDHVHQIEHALRKLGIPHAEAAKYAPRVHAGAYLVTVNAPFGEGSQAEYVLDGAKTIDSGHATHHHDAVGMDDPAPFSKALGLKLLIDNPAPLSSALGFTTLSKQQNSKTKLSENPAPLSNATKMPLLSGKAAPLSGAVGMATLSDNPAPLSRAVGMKVLSEQAAPLSTRIGWNTLSSEPAPLSKLLGLPVLLDKAE